MTRPTLVVYTYIIMTTTKKITYYTLLTLISLGFIMAAYPKLTGAPAAAAGFAQAHLPLWFMYFIGLAELLGGIGLWIPKFSKWATYGLYIILAGAVVVTLIFNTAIMVLMPIAFGAILAIVRCLGKKKIPAPTA